MPADFSMTAILFVFYLTFAGQIYLLSIHYPNQLAKRISFVLKNYPPSEYPKLYPSGFTTLAAGARAGRLTVFRRYNQLVALLGGAILVAMLASGYRPAAEGGDEIFVMLYFFLQTVPFIVIAISEFRSYKLMHKAFQNKRRSAELRPRRLFDFVSPAYVVAAVVLFVAWVSFYVVSAGALATWTVEKYATLILISGMNLAYIAIVWKAVSGTKLDPYQAYSDQVKTIESTTKTMVFSSIMISLFLILTQGADEYGLEVFDPPLVSFYMQLCVVMGMGLTMRLTKIEDVDFSVYRADAATPSPDNAPAA